MIKIQITHNYMVIDKYVKTPINDKDIINNLNYYLSRISENKAIEKFFGKNEVFDYDVKIENSLGYAEWWDRDLLDRTKDLLILYANKDSLNIDDFEHIIYHEIYPGHGYFLIF